MHLIGLARLGKDAELRFTNDGTPVANLALAYNWGRKDNEGKRPTQWVDASLWGERAQALQQWLVKGQQFNVHLSDVRIETYEKNGGGTGSKLVGRVDVIEFAGSRPEGQQSAPAPQQRSARNEYADAKGAAQPPANRPQPRPAPNFSDMDDDIPF